MRIYICILLIVHEDIAALDVPVQEVLLVAVVEPIQQLLHDAGIVRLVEVHHLGLQQPHQVVVHVLKHQVEGAFILETTCSSYTNCFVYNRFHSVAV